MVRPLVLVGLLLLNTSCGKSNQSASNSGGGDVAGEVRIDGSSTVFPISEAVAEEFRKEQPSTKVSVGTSGTGGGFKKFCAGEIDISDASRPIKTAERDLCKKNNIGWVEVPIAYDGIVIVVNPKNDWATSMTASELKKLWEPEAQGKVMKWSDVRAGWPEKEIHLFGPGVDSGTYDYFTEAIVKKEHASRGDFTSSEDDNVLVQGVSRDELALGFFGIAYYLENKDKLKALSIDDEKPENGTEPVAASVETVAAHTYQPLSRPLFVYAATKSLEKKEVSSFLSFYLKNAAELSKEVGYVPLKAESYTKLQQRVEKKVEGSLFDGAAPGTSVETLLQP